MLLPISWEKGVKDSRIQGAKGLFSNDLKPLFNLMNPILYSFNNEILNQNLFTYRTYIYILTLRVYATFNFTLEPLNPGLLESLV